MDPIFIVVNCIGMLCFRWPLPERVILISTFSPELH
jgi:hypothetical protein